MRKQVIVMGRLIRSDMWVRFPWICCCIAR